MPAPPRLVQLVPAAPGGLRDYAANIQRVWWTWGVESRLLPLAEGDVVASPLWLHLGSGAPTVQTVLIVHYSGYGYDRRGLCSWLNRELSDARLRLGQRLRVVVMFHELYASGPPWRSAFWLSRRQASIAAELAALCDVALTNTGQHARWLEQQLGNQNNVAVWPVFSNVGEPVAIVPFAARQRRLVVFGTESTRRRALRQVHRHAWQLGRLGIEEMVEVGVGVSVGPPSGMLRSRFAGRLDESALQALLSRSAFGLIEYPLHCMGKSGVFAAYAAHGCVVLNAHPSQQGADGLRPGAHFLDLDPSRPRVPDDESLDQMVGQAKSWYDQHTLKVQTAALARTCGIDPRWATSLARQD